MPQYTLSIIKPDAMRRELASDILKQLYEAGLSLIAQKKLQLSQAQAEEFYAEHKGKPFYNSLVAFMTSGEVIVQILGGPDAVTLNRTIMGATNPQDAAPGTIRNKYGTSIEKNCVHGSDSPESAMREVRFFFGEKYDYLDRPD